MAPRAKSTGYWVHLLIFCIQDHRNLRQPTFLLLQMCDIPVAVADHERVVRAVFSHHLNKNKKIREYLFSPGCGPDEVSVMRHSYLGTDACRKEACKVKPANPGVRYKGLA